MEKKIVYAPYINVSEQEGISKGAAVLKNLDRFAVNALKFISRNYFYEFDNLGDLHNNLQEINNKITPCYALISNVDVVNIEEMKNSTEAYEITVMDSYGELKIGAFRKNPCMDGVLYPEQLEEENWQALTSLKPLDNISIYFNAKVYNGKTILIHFEKDAKGEEDSYNTLDDILKRSKIKTT